MIEKETIKKAYENGEGSLRVLSEKYNVNLSTIKSWKSRDTKKGCEWRKKDATDAKWVANRKEKKRIEKAVEEITKSNLSEQETKYCIYRGMGYNILQSGLKAGYSKNTATVKCYKMDRKVRIREEIRKFQKIRYESLIQNEKDIILQYLKIAFTDIGDYLVENGNGDINFNSLDKMDTTGIKEINIEKDMKSKSEKIKLKLESKLPALRALGEHFGMFSDNGIGNEDKNIIINLVGVDNEHKHK